MTPFALWDTGPLAALINRGEINHARCQATLPSLRGYLLTTWPCLAEAMHFHRGYGGYVAQKELWGFNRDGMVRPHTSSDPVFARMEVLMEPYRDRPMDLADASLVAAAETLDVQQIFSTDRDFYVYRWRDRGAFDVVPGPASLGEFR